MSLNAQLIVGALSFMVVSGGIILWAKLAFDREFPGRDESAAIKAETRQSASN